MCNGGDWSVDEELGAVVTVDVADVADVKASSGGGEGDGAGTMVNVDARMTRSIQRRLTALVFSRGWCS